MTVSHSYKNEYIPTKKLVYQRSSKVYPKSPQTEQSKCSYTGEQINKLVHPHNNTLLRNKRSEPLIPVEQHGWISRTSGRKMRDTKACMPLECVLGSAKPVYGDRNQKRAPFGRGRAQASSPGAGNALQYSSSGLDLGGGYTGITTRVIHPNSSNCSRVFALHCM